MVEICKKCKGEGILNKETGEPVDYFGTWREDGTAVVICDACDGKLVVDVIEVNKESEVKHDGITTTLHNKKGDDIN